MNKKLLVIDAAALGWQLVEKAALQVEGLKFKKLDPVFPAITCPVQATFRTAQPPEKNGVLSNGLFARDLMKVLFWEQSSALVHGARIWEPLRTAGKKVGLLFWQQSLGESVDFVLSPKPIHKHHGGMIQDCYSQPHDLYEKLCAEIGRPFNLMHYWGPLASAKSTEWIAAATQLMMSSPELAPDLLITYLPHLDYDLQRLGPDDSKIFQSLEKLKGWFSNVWKTAQATGYDLVIFGDYAIEEVTGDAIFPNRALCDCGLLRVRKIKGMAYADLFSSAAFAIADHQIAQVPVLPAGRKEAIRIILEKLDGVAEIIEQEDRYLLVAKPGRWFAYPWWTDPKEAPDYAGHVDIHNKPGYDPCELFFGWPPGSVSQKTRRIRGTHGRVGPGMEVAWASSVDFPGEPKTLLELSRAVRAYLT